MLAPGSPQGLGHGGWEVLKSKNRVSCAAQTIPLAALLESAPAIREAPSRLGRGRRVRRSVLSSLPLCEANKAHILCRLTWNETQ